jgi:hypothetical protein
MRGAIYTVLLMAIMPYAANNEYKGRNLYRSISCYVQLRCDNVVAEGEGDDLSAATDAAFAKVQDRAEDNGDDPEDLGVSKSSELLSP